MIAVSIVSHGHGAMVRSLLDQVLACAEVGQVIVTHNVPEEIPPCADQRVEVIRNSSARGFGANHNAAFRRCREPFWCVLNPDVEFMTNPYPVLLAALARHSAGVVAPLVTDKVGAVEDSVRHFPTLTSLALKSRGRDISRYALQLGDVDCYPEWVAGMFMLFGSPVFAALGGFDERYYLYYEDVDICWRAWRSGHKVVACPAVSVVHDARRASRVSWQHRRWHLASMLRFLARSFARRPAVGDLHGV